MLIIGDLSGIQDYLFDVASEGGQQSRRLRARSFFIQLAAECLALRILKAAGCAPPHLLFCGAGKFIIEPAALSAEQRQALQAEAQQMNLWLLNKTNAQLRLSLAMSEAGHTAQERYETALAQLQADKLRPWASVAVPADQWDTARLRLDAISPPCAICRRRKGVVTDVDDETGETRTICRRCEDDRRLGRAIPQTNWIALADEATNTDDQSWFGMPGWNVKVFEHRPATHAGPLLHLTNQLSAESEAQVFPRALARHIPRNADGSATDFATLAGRAKGDKLLAILKADADGLGSYINGLLSNAEDFLPLSRFSREMDSFFGITLNDEMKKPEWNSIYTIFAGGDDLLLIGPWNVIFDFAGLANEMFLRKFGARGLTISAGITLIKPKRPIKQAVARAEELLHLAKSQPALNALSPKNQVAAFGQIWKWQDHAALIGTAKQLTQWVEDGLAERGWLQTLLQLAEQRQQGGLAGAMATARLAHHVARNYPRANDRDRNKAELRRWADRLVADFDTGKNLETNYLLTILRYAITATRSTTTEDER